MTENSTGGMATSQESGGGRGALTQARLRTAAIEAFAENGFHATKVSDIVAKAGVTQPTFCNYFDSNDVAYETLVTRFRQGLKQIAADNLIGAGTPPAQLGRHVESRFQRLLDFMMADRQLTEIGFFQPPGCSVTKGMMVEWLSQNIVAEQQAGLLRADIPAPFIARMQVGLLEQMARPGAGGDTQQLAQVCAALFCEGAKARSA